MNGRSRDGRETWRRLLEWDKGQAAAERLAGQALRFEGFTSIDPSHPLGGPDGLKDIVCIGQSKKWIGAAYFPRGQQSFGDISKKLLHDLEGIKANDADGLAFVTNQELTLGDRATLVTRADQAALEIIHLERLSSILDSPQCYGIRLEFLDIEMSKEEQLAFISQRDAVLGEMKQSMDAMVKLMKEGGGKDIANANIRTVYPQTVGSSVGAATVYGRQQAKECSFCHAVYLVESGHYVTSAVVYGVGGMTVVTCPYCGRAERYHPIW